MSTNRAGLTALCFSFASCFLSTSAADKPNVIVIMADDQGSVDLGSYGATDLATPHTDALAARGVRFTQFYSAAPVCSPSRAGMLTGRWPVRAGVPGNCSSQKGGKGALPPEEITMAEMFKAGGYATAHIGKWHIGYTPETLPLAQGFDHSFGHMGGCIDNFSHFFYWNGPNIHDLWRNGTEVYHDGEFFPDLMVREASQFIEANREKPFFIYYALNSPHYPYQGDAKWLEHFKSLPYPRNLYAAFVAAKDERLGHLFAKVDKLGLREKTIVVFQSDNGHSTEERAHFGGGSAGPIEAANSVSSRAASVSPRSSRGRDGYRRTKSAISWRTRVTGSRPSPRLPVSSRLRSISTDAVSWTCSRIPPRPHPTRDGLSTGKWGRDPRRTGPCVRANGN